MGLFVKLCRRAAKTLLRKCSWLVPFSELLGLLFYRFKMHFRALDAAALLGAPRFPPGTPGAAALGGVRRRGPPLGAPAVRRAALASAARAAALARQEDLCKHTLLCIVKPDYGLQLTNAIKKRHNANQVLITSHLKRFYSIREQVNMLNRRCFDKKRIDRLYRRQSPDNLEESYRKEAITELYNTYIQEKIDQLLKFSTYQLI